MSLIIESRFIDKASRPIQKLDKNLATLDKRTITTNKTFLGLNAGLAKLAGGFIAVSSAINGAKAVVTASDEYKTLQSRLILVSNSTEEFVNIQDKLFQSAQSTRTELTSVADLYAQMSRSTQNLNINSDRLLAITDLINKTLTISGGNAQSASAGLVQLSQGFAGGALRGQEFNSVLEQTPRLAQAISDGLKVSIGGLRQLANEGKLTTEVVLNAIENQANTINKEIEKVSLTSSQALTTLSNSFVVLSGKLDDATGLTSTYATSLQDISKYLDQNQAELIAFAQTSVAVIGKTIDGFNLLYETVENTGQILINGLNITVYGALNLISKAILNVTESLNAISLASNSSLEKVKTLSNFIEKGLTNAQSNLISNTEELKNAYVDFSVSIEDRIKLNEQEGKQYDETLRKEKEQLNQLKELQKVQDVLKQARATIDPYASKLEDINSKYRTQYDLLVKNSASQKELITLTQAWAVELEKINSKSVSTQTIDTSFIDKQKEFKQQLEDLNKSQSQLELENLARDYDLYGANLDKKSQAYENFVNRVNQLGEQMYQEQLEKSDNAFAGIQHGLKSLTDNMQSDFKIASNTTVKAIEGMSTELAKFATTGKADFGDLAKSIIADLIKIQIQKQLTGIFGSIIGGFTGGASVGAGTTTAGAGGGAISAFQAYKGGKIPEYAQGGQVVSFGGGGYTGDGGKYEPKGIVHGGEYVFTKEQTRNIGMQNIERFANGGMVGNSTAMPKINVIVNNNGNSEVQTRQENNEEQIDIIVDIVEKRLTSGVTQGTSELASTLESTYSLGRGLQQ